MTHSKPSKTALKREHLELQELGLRLIGLDPDTLDELPIESRLRDAVVAAATIRSRGALRRQKQLIGKLMRNVDADALRAALDIRSADESRRKRVFSDAERWRDRVVEEGDTALRAFEAETGASHTELEHLLSTLDSSTNDRSARSIRRQIFRRIHDELLARAQDDRISR